LFVCFLSGTLWLQGQEICDNAIDDDGDGLVDLNDNDCICDGLSPSSLIPNPSFEEMSCCPTANEMLHCANNWIQASAATTDYVHTCENYLGNTSIPAYAPLPFPDGEGGVGFRDGQEHAGINYKEYVGACLLEPMEVGVSYRIDFFVGFQDNVTGSKHFDIALFASTNCNNLPFGGNNYQIGCPVNAGNYVQLGETFVSGSNEWVNVVFEFTADQAYEVFVLGPSCSLNPNYYLDPYFYVDRLTLAKSTDFEVPLESVNGSICENNLVIQAPSIPGASYQWYQDGIAMIGQTNQALLLTSIDNAEGTYVVLVTTDDGCYLSQDYDLLIPPYYETTSASICESEFYVFGNDSVNTPGLHEWLLEATDGCDSIFQVILDVRQNSYASILDTFCIGEDYLFEDIYTTEAGTFETQLVNAVGCDSLITLNLTGIGSGIGVVLPEIQFINLGESIQVAPLFFDPIYTQFQWTDEAGNLLSSENAFFLDQPEKSLILYLQANNSAGCLIRDSLEIIVIPDYSVYIPNVFSPDGNGINDEFKCYLTGAVESVVSFSVYDRWGNLIYSKENNKEWDGRINGEPAMQGVYVYMIRIKFLNGVEKVYAGDVTLIR
jgi:gliding motility-associated-like protein